MSTKIVAVENCGDYLLVKTDGAQFQIYLLDDNIIRLRGTFANEFAPEASYALVKTAWDDQTDAFMADERQRVTPLSLKIQENETSYSVATSKYVLKINKSPFGFEISDTQGRILHRDLPGRTFWQDSKGRS